MERELLFVEENKINKTISNKWLLNMPLSSHRKTPHVIISELRVAKWQV